MPSERKITHADYYETFPTSENSAGDIWSGLPAHGFLRTPTVRGIVITPACDLANRKVDTITYLPIVTVREYFALPSFLPELYREIEGQLQKAGVGGILTTDGKFRLPPRHQLDLALAQLRAHAATGIRQSDQSAIERACAGYEILRTHYSDSLVAPDLQLLKVLLGAKVFVNLLSDIARNSHRLDLHFLPADMQRPEWTAIPEHSVVLFRYAFSAPVSVLECAQDVHEADWSGAVERLAESNPGVRSFDECAPLKRARLKPRFLSDLLTRYVALYVRLGSPDFTADTISTFAGEIESYQ